MLGCPSSLSKRRLVRAFLCCSCGVVGRAFYYSRQSLLLCKTKECRGCGAAQFNNNGCENCPFLMMAGDSQRVAETTTISYHGMVAVLDPTASWAAKWLHVGAPGRCCHLHSCYQALGHGC